MRPSIGHRVIRVDRTASTSDLAFEQPAEDGLVIVAREQTAGRGRRGRHWEAPPGAALLLSVVLLPPRKVPPPQLSVLGAVAACEAIARLPAVVDAGQATAIKWPNDVLLGGAKVGGVLAEARPGAPDDRVVLGIGLNCDQAADQLPARPVLPATSLRLATGAPTTPDAVLRPLLDALDQRYTELCAGDDAALDRAWRARTGLLGQRVRLEHGGEEHRGVVVSLSLTDGVELEADDGPRAGQRRWFRGEHTSLLERLPEAR